MSVKSHWHAGGTHARARHPPPLDHTHKQPHTHFPASDRGLEGRAGDVHEAPRARKGLGKGRVGEAQRPPPGTPATPAAARSSTGPVGSVPLPNKPSKVLHEHLW